MTELIFIGEQRSLTAKRKGWTWKDGRLAAKPLFEALAAMGVDPAAHGFTNLWQDGVAPEHQFVGWQKVAWLRKQREEGAVLVALGKRVSDELARRGVDHVALVHPAARGKIRKRERYVAHVKEKLAPVVRPTKRIRISFDAHQSMETYEVETKRGWRRVKWRDVEHDIPSAQDLERWFRSMGITRVVSAIGNTGELPDSCLRDGDYPVGRYLAWARRMERD